jgi:hypothetical protein
MNAPPSGQSDFEGMQLEALFGVDDRSALAVVDGD